MKVAVFDLLYLTTPHFDVSLELLRKHALKGDETTYVFCDAAHGGCDMNPGGVPAGCIRCRATQREGLRRIRDTRPAHLLPSSRLLSGIKPQFPPIPRNLEELKQLRYGPFDAGMGVASTLIWLHRNPHLDLTPIAAQVRRLLDHSICMYEASRRYLREEKPDRVYIFNGRFSLCRSVLRACQQEAVEIMVHERGADLSKYSLTPNALPHEIAPFVERAKQAWGEADPAARIQIAEDFYNARRQGKVQSWKSFVTGQESGFLPPGWDSTKYNVVIFNSSEDEMAAIGDEWKNHLYRNQADGIQKIAADLAGRSDVRVYLRVHPNLAEVNNESVAALQALRFENFTLIPPDSKVSTYQLIDCASLVISFGSTTGAEAAFMGTPSVLAGNCFYASLGSVYTPESHEELMRICLSKPPPLDRTGALIYGHYLNTFGESFQYFRPTDVHAGTFLDRPLGPSRVGQSLLSRNHWPGSSAVYRFVLALMRLFG